MKRLKLFIEGYFGILSEIIKGFWKAITIDKRILFKILYVAVIIASPVFTIILLILAIIRDDVIDKIDKYVDKL